MATARLDFRGFKFKTFSVIAFPHGVGSEDRQIAHVGLERFVNLRRVWPGDAGEEGRRAQRGLTLSCRSWTPRWACGEV